MIFNATKLHRELELALIPITGCNSDGRITFKPEATPEQMVQADAIKAAHNPDTLLPEEQAIKDDFAVVKTSQVQTVLAQIASARTQIQTDLTDLQAATTINQVKTIIARILNRQDNQLELEAKLVRAIARLADRE